MELKQFFLNILRFGAVAGAGAAKMGRHGVASYLTFSNDIHYTKFLYKNSQI